MKKERLISLRKKMLRQMAFSLTVLALLPLTAQNIPSDTPERTELEVQEIEAETSIRFPMGHCTKLKG